MRFDHKYAEAEEIIRALQKNYPRDPGIYFLLASNLHDDMLNREDYSKMETMNALFDSAIQLSEKDASDPWNTWIIGSSLGYRAIVYAEIGKYISAIRTASDAMDYLERARQRHETAADAALGIGGYKYWKSEKLGFLTYLPFIDDEREHGIAEVRYARRNSIYSREASIHALVYIFCAEGMIDSARAMRDSIAENHPNSLLPLWYDLAIEEKDGNFKRYFLAANELSIKLDSIGIEQSANRIEVHKLAAEAATKLDDWEMVCNHCLSVLDEHYPPSIACEKQKTIEILKQFVKKASKKGVICGKSK